LHCSFNQLTSAALNNLFETLPGNTEAKSIHIGDNPGTEDCNRSIAEEKEWLVGDYWHGLF
jgi:hypothetical protein